VEGDTVLKRLVVTTVAVLVGATGGVAVAQPAQAKTYGSATFNAGPEPVKAGSYVTLSGRLSGSPLRDGTVMGGYGSVEFYFKKSGASSYKFINHALADSRGHYSKRLRQHSSGTWKAVVRWCMCDDERTQGPVKRDYVATKR
jgi:hypothetical protein